MGTRTFAYIRVSSKDQNEARQLSEMQELGVHEDCIFIDKASGKNFDRPQYKTMISRIREDDLLIIKSIDRFGRNASEIKKEWEFITGVKKADIQVLDMPLLDTKQFKDKMGTFVSELVLQVLSFVADSERDNTLQRQKEGIAAAKAQGKHLGRPKLTLDSLSKDQKEKLKTNYPRWKERKEITAVEFMGELELKKNSFYKIIKEYEEKELAV